MFILKRLVNNKWKQAFAVETAHADFVKPLNKADTKKLESFVSQNADILVEFEAYDHPVDSILNIGFALKRKADRTKLQNAVAQELGEELETGITCDQILGAIAKTPYAEFCGEAPQSRPAHIKAVDLLGLASGSLDSTRIGSSFREDCH